MVYDIMTRRAAQDLRGKPRVRLLVRGAQPRALPRQRVRPAARRRRRVPDHSVEGAVARGARTRPRCSPSSPTGRAGSILCTGPHRLGQVDHARGDGQPRQRERVRAHPHDRGPDRVPARIEEVPDQPARARAAHAVVPERAAQRAARGPRLHPGRRNARPRDDPPRADRRRDRPPGVRHAAHELGRQDHRPDHRRVPGRRKGHGPLDAVGVAGGGDLADAAEDQGRPGPRRRARDHDRHAGDPQPDPREQGRADVLVDPDQPGHRHADARPEPAGARPPPHRRGAGGARPRRQQGTVPRPEAPARRTAAAKETPHGTRNRHQVHPRAARRCSSSRTARTSSSPPISRRR